MDSSVLIRDQFKSFLLSKKANGIADKTLATYEQQFSAISKHLDVNKPIDFLCKKDLQKMIADMRDTNLSSNTIRSYTATLKTFFTWCREEGIADLDIPLYKAEDSHLHSSKSTA